MLPTAITEATVWWVRLEFQLMDGAFLNTFILDGERKHDLFNRDNEKFALYSELLFRFSDALD